MALNAFEEQFNNLLAETFRIILKVEAEALESPQFRNISMADVHLLAAVEKEEGGVGQIAARLGLASPTVTVAVRKLEKNGYLTKSKSKLDGRGVVVRLTKEGTRVCALHAYFHENMVRDLQAGMEEAEREALLKGVIRLNKYFTGKLKENKQ